MKFEFKLKAGEPQIKEPPLRLNPYDFLKTIQAHQEVVAGFPIFTDAFGRTLYQTPNGQFRAIGDRFDLVANVGQKEDELVTLAPQPDDDEEDTMPGQKFKKKGGGIIVDSEYKFKTPFVFTGYSLDTYKISIYALDFEKLEVKEIFTKPNDETSDWWHLSDWILGFYNKSAIVLGYNENWEERIYQIGMNHNVIRSVPLEQGSWFSNGKFTLYNDVFYYATYKSDDWYATEIFSLGRDLSFKKVAEYPVQLDNIKFWKNFIAYQNEYTVCIYDYIKDKQIAEINIEYKLTLRMVDFSNQHACFVLAHGGSSGKQYQDYHLCKCYFILLKSNGEYQTWEEYGVNGIMASDGYTTYTLHHPHYIYTNEPIVAQCFWEYGGVLYATSPSAILERMADGRWRTIHRISTSAPLTTRVKLSDGRILFGTNQTSTQFPPQAGTSGYLHIYTHSTSSDYQGGSSEAILLKTDIAIKQLLESNGTILAATRQYRSPYKNTLFISHDGESWQEINVDPWGSSKDVVIICFQNGLVFATKDGNKLWKSTNQGITWQEMEPYTIKYVWDSEKEEYVPTEVDLYGFRSIVDMGSYLLGVDSTGTLYSSYSGGGYWINFGSELKFQSMVKFEGVLYFTSKIGHIYRSVSGGETLELMQITTSEKETYAPQPGTTIKEVFRDGDLYLLTEGHLFTVSGSRLHGIDILEMFKEYKVKKYINNALAGTDTITAYSTTLPLKPEILGQGELQIGDRITKMYNEELWINSASYRYNYGILFNEIQDITLPTFYWFGHYLLYSGYEDDESDVYGLFAIDLRTMNKKLLYRNLEANFTIEQFVNYYLR